MHAAWHRCRPWCSAEPTGMLTTAMPPHCTLRPVVVRDACCSAVRSLIFIPLGRSACDSFLFERPSRVASLSPNHRVTVSTAPISSDLSRGRVATKPPIKAKAWVPVTGGSSRKSRKTLELPTLYMNGPTWYPCCTPGADWTTPILPSSTRSGSFGGALATSCWCTELGPGPFPDCWSDARPVESVKSIAAIMG